MATANLEPTSPTQPRWMTIVGWVLTILAAFVFVVGGAYAALHPEMMKEGMQENGWPLDLVPYLVAVEIICGLIYLFPKTAVLGAILLTGYLGGAVATHVRIHDIKGIAPVVIGIIVWLGIYLREPRLRQIVFWRWG
jgi:hypothetical protein